MKWRNLICNGGYYLCDTVFITGVRGIKWAGTLASLSAGLCSAASFALDESLSAGFAVQANATGSGEANATTTGINTNHYQAYDFFKAFSLQGHFEGSLTDYVTPLYLQLAALAPLGTGITLKSISAFLNLFFRGLQESDDYFRNDDIDLPLPKYCEFIYVVLEAACESISLSMVTNAILLSILRYSPLLQNYEASYPSESNRSIDFNNISVPADQFNYQFGLNNDFFYQLNRQGIRLSSTLNTSLNFNASALYGAGAKLLCGKVNGAAIIPTALTSIATYGFSLFCGNQARKRRDRRLMASEAFVEGDGCDLSLPCFR